MAGDAVRTKSAAAEVRLKDGTRIFIPPASQFVVKGALLPAKFNSATQGMLAILDGGAVVIPTTTLDSFKLASANQKMADGSTPVSFSLANLFTSLGPTSPIVGIIAQALQTNGVQVTQSGGSLIITGIKATVGDSGSAQAVSLVYSSAGLSVYAGTVTSLQNLPPPITTIPSQNGVPPGCKGDSTAPQDKSNSVIRITAAGTC
jgi:hypothetical protein